MAASRLDSVGPAASKNSVRTGLPLTNALGPKKPLQVGVIGLGAGVIGAWMRPGDALVFYEISPRVVLEMSPDGPVYVEPNPEGYVAGESVYLMITAAVGIVSAVAVWMLVRKRRGPILLAGLAVAAMLS